MAVVINGELIEDSVIREEMRSLRSRYEEMTDLADPVAREIQLREWSRENVIERVLLRQEAERDRQPLPAGEVEQALEQFRNTPGAAGCASQDEPALRALVETRLRIDRMLAKVTAKVSPPRQKEVGDYYTKNREQFWSEELVHARHIIKNVDERQDEAAALAGMQQVAAELASGADFAGLADGQSDCAGNGGDLGWFPRGQMVDEFESVVWSLPVGEISPIFRTVFGFHIAQLLGRRPEGARALPEVRAEIERLLHTRKQERAVEQFLDRLKARATIADSAEAAPGA